MKAVTHVRLVLEDQVLDNHSLIYGDRIAALVPDEQLPATGLEVTDGEGAYLSPGLIDLHIHGRQGADVMDGNRDSLQTIAASVAAQGVTGFLGTTMTMALPAIARAVEAARQWLEAPGPGAELLGLHLEGPFISPRYKGAQNQAHILAPDFDLVAPWLDVVRIVTLAPEAAGALEFIDRLRGKGVVAAIGHSAATCEEALAAFGCGATHITHCFNAMSPLHHRAPGVVGAALGWPFTAELICDDIHVNPVFYQGFLNIKGLDRAIAVTDCMQAGGLPDGAYTLGGQPVEVREGACRLADGTLAGSTLQMNQALKHLGRSTDLTVPQLVRLGSLNPARVLGLEGERGSLAPGKRADFFLHDGAFRVFRTVCGGADIFQA